MDESLTGDADKLRSAHSRLSPSRKVPPQVVASELPIYEELLSHDPRWALSEGSRHFEENSAVFKALHHIAQRLKALGIPYAVIGGMALFRHGLRRFTEDVDILVTKEDLKKIHEKLEGLGYLPPFTNSKHLRDVEFGVKIEFLTTGDYPGDGKKKPVSFPDPRDFGFEAEGVNYINLEKLVELKLASGMTNSGRLKDLSDVLELIKVLDLPADYVIKLNPYVAEKFTELWMQSRKRYIKIWRKRSAATETPPPDDASVLLGPTVVGPTVAELEKMRRDGIVIEHQESDNSLRLTTYDVTVAEKYGLIDESEYWDDEQDIEK